MRERCACSAAMLFASLVLLATGCGKSGEPVGTVSGKITYQGQPVTEGSVSFNNDRLGASGTGEIQPDGTYQLATQGAGLPPGSYKVCIVPPMEEQSTSSQLAASLEPKEMPDIPQKYRSFQTSDLEATVQEGTNELDFDMQ